MNYKVTLSFDGSGYKGWQFQKNGITVQAVVTDAANRFFSAPATVTGCSRTDSGVHAVNYVCNIQTERVIPADAVVRGMNTFLPDTVAVKACETADDSFHARYDCVSKEYHYLIHNSRIPDPFMAKRAYFFSAELDAERMARDAEEMLGTHNFTSFMATGSKITDPTRTVFSTSVTRDGELITFSVAADGFLYNMVRIMVGTLIDLNLGRNTMTVGEIIEAHDRSKAGFTAPPEGLYLYRVNY